MYALPADINKQELRVRLQAIDRFLKVMVIELSNPIKAEEFFEVRKLMGKLNWDTTRVTNDDLSLYFNARFNAQFTYYIDHTSSLNEDGQNYTYIKPIEEHPDYDMIMNHGLPGHPNPENAEVIFNNDQALLAELEQNQSQQSLSKLPNNFNNMTDAEIKNWIMEKDTRKIEEQNIKIKRSGSSITLQRTKK